MNKEVKLYTFSTCPFCTKAKNLLDKENIKYEEIEISDNIEGLNRLEKFTGCNTVPQIFVNKKFIGGYDDLVELYNEGKFSKIFK
ncbi:glutathione S-transferase N-terminal domain-containing protein [Clostridium sp. D2Q-14]|uniref:glutaredoxin domain-containing protein n=1 Tax=Anaeromonas gelatinilytica TaxID=2683194 RepID=UPI00193C2FE8|nr:glutaredoxin domain-containing protein [Anaeromonas gelatinilytica]MBS4534320.1 glutathione S-transferase N-terminal domain-containing protein [Anaeromonas gelatinilytica]